MDARKVVELALAVRRGQQSLHTLPEHVRIAVQQASRRMTDAQFSRLAEQSDSRSKFSNRAYPRRGLHDGSPTR